MKGMNLRNQLFPELGYITSTRYQYGKKRQFEFKLDRALPDRSGKTLPVIWIGYPLHRCHAALR